MIRDRVLFDLPAYEGLLAGHYIRGAGYGRRRPGGTDDWLLVMTLAGEGRFGHETGELVSRAPALTLIAPGTTHDYGITRTAVSWEILWVHFHPPREWLELLRWPEVYRGISAWAPSSPTEIEVTFREVVRASTGTHQRSLALAMNALERLLLLLEMDRPSASAGLDQRLQVALDYIHTRLASELSLDELAGVAALSVSRFAHLFRSQMGISPRQYILQQRLHRGRGLVERTSMGVAEIAREVGMDPFQFSSRFKSEYGRSPREFRRQAPSDFGG